MINNSINNILDKYVKNICFKKDNVENLEEAGYTNYYDTTPTGYYNSFMNNVRSYVPFGLADSDEFSSVKNKILSAHKLSAENLQTAKEHADIITNKFIAASNNPAYANGTNGQAYINQLALEQKRAADQVNYYQNIHNKNSEILNNIDNFRDNPNGFDAVYKDQMGAVSQNGKLDSLFSQERALQQKLSELPTGPEYAQQRASLINQINSIHKNVDTVNHLSQRLANKEISQADYDKQVSGISTSTSDSGTGFGFDGLSNFATDHPGLMWGLGGLGALAAAGTAYSYFKNRQKNKEQQINNQQQLPPAQPIQQLPPAQPIQQLPPAQPMQLNNVR